jgi:hypothetical protein
MAQGAERLFIASGGTLEGETGSTVTLASATVTALTSPTVSATNIDAGASGTAGTVDVFPTTASKGKIQIAAADSAGDTTTTITNASQAAARTYTIPDAGGAASFVMTAGAQSIGGDKTFTGSLRAPEMFLPASADAAITLTAYSQSIYITKAGVCALTLADPTATTHDGCRLTIISTTANAHTVSNAAGSGFNDGGGAADIATFGGAKGDSMIIEAYQGKWYVVNLLNVTLA